MGGTAVRLGRLFNPESGRTFMIAFDRPMMAGPGAHAADSLAVLRSLSRTSADAILLGPGLLKEHGREFARQGAPACVVRIDFPILGDSGHGHGEFLPLICEPGEAMALGADAVVMLLVDGFEDAATYAANVAQVARCAAACRRLGLPLIVETVLWGAAASDQRDPARLAALARSAAELGADLIKTQYTGDPQSMATIVKGCPAPVTVLGGPIADWGTIERDTRDAMSAGAKGVIYGRNVWESPDMLTVAERFSKLVHG